MRHPHAQRGYALLAFTAALSVILLSFVIGYSFSLAKQESLRLESNQQAYLLDVQEKLETLYQNNATSIDADASWTTFSNASDLLRLAGVQSRWDVQIAISVPLVKNSVRYRVIGVWLPNSELAQAPVFDPNTGNFTECPSGAPCASTPHLSVSGYAVQAALYEKTEKLLEELAVQAQAYFKARTLIDADHNVSYNYFRSPYSNCTSVATEMPCVNDYTPLSATRVPSVLSLSPQQLTNAWGLPVEVSNLKDAESGTPPYTLVFRTPHPWGGYLTKKAVQQL